VTSLVRLLGIKWTYLVAGLVLLSLGVFGYLTAHPSQPVELDGTLSSYGVVTYNGSYGHNELTLTGDDSTYTLDRSSFHPALPAQVYKDGKVQIWIEQGSTTIIAITLYDENDESPIKYTTGTYDNPGSELSDTQNTAITATAVGAVLIAVFGVWLGVERSRAVRSPSGSLLVGTSAPDTRAGVGLSADLKWYWDGDDWYPVSDDGRFRWDGESWQEMGTAYSAKGAPPPPSG
jgi:hypothetical protein